MKYMKKFLFSENVNLNTNLYPDEVNICGSEHHAL